MKNSGILKDLTQIAQLHQWVKESTKTNVKFELLWKGTRDGFGAATFHSKCDKKGPTLTVIKSEHDKVFGGFTSESWGFAPRGKDQCKKDPTAFIYSLTRNGKYAQQRNDNSICDNSGYGPIFGLDPSIGCDIFIYDDCNTYQYNGCYANQTYQLPPGAGDNFLAGSDYYSVKEIEVYAIKNI
jgi:hypothetical protein